MLKFIQRFYQIINVAIIIALLIIHFVLKDSSFKKSLLFYSFPLPIIILIILGLTIFLSRKVRRYNLILAAVLLVVWLGRSFKVNLPEDIIDTDIEVVFWNASHDRGFQEAFNENEAVPDVLVLVEMSKNKIKDLQQKYPNYYFYESEEGIGIFSKTPLEIEWEKSSKFSTIVLKFKTEGVIFYAVDGVASMDVPRAWGLKYINSLIEEKEKTILLGDFNIPLESTLLKLIEVNFNNAFAEKGNGFRETWFWNIPLLSLDQIWVSKDLKILKTEKISTFKSDHSMLKTYIRK